MKNKKGFTLVELIVVMAVIGVLVLLAMPKFMGYTKEARLTELKSNIKTLEDASERYYINEQDWPRGSEIPYTVEELESFANEIKNRTGAIITLEESGKYYPIDYKKLQSYVQEPKSGVYVLQNPVGEVFYLDDLTEKGIQTFVEKKREKPVAVIEMTEGNLYTNTILSFKSNSQPGSGTITNLEWQINDGEITSSIKDSSLPVGNHTVRLRVTNSYGDVSEWASKDFTVHSFLDVSTNGMPGYALPNGTVADASRSYSSQVPSNAMDGKLNTAWNAGTYQGWISFTFPHKVKIKFLNVCGDVTPTTTQTYQIYGLKDGVWSLLLSKSVDIVENNAKGVILDPIEIPEDYYDGIKIEILRSSTWASIIELTIS